MIFTYTANDKKLINALEKKFEKLFKMKEAEIDRLRDPKDVPVEPDRPETMTDAQREKWNREVTEIFDRWEADGSEEWRKARRDYFALQNDLIEARRQLLHEIEIKHFSKLGGDRDKIIESAREQSTEIINKRFAYYQKTIEDGKRPEDDEQIESFSARDLRVDADNNIYLDAQQMIEDIKGALHLHYDALKYDKEAVSLLDEIVINAVSKSPHVSDSAGKRFGYVKVNHVITPEITVRTKTPTSFITPIDKVSNKAFDGAFNDGEVTGVEIIKKSKSRKPIYTMVSIDFSELENVQISGRRELTAYDREVHDSIVTLYTEGGNEFITINMIYQTMTGKVNAHCSPKQAEAISESITKLMFSHVIIDASQEAQVDKRLVRVKYDSNMINAKRITISLNGVVTEAIQILASPILLDYAQQKNQIGRFDVKLLDTPNNKNEETIVLEGYLRRRILSIKGSSKLSPTILYDTIYKQLEISRDNFTASSYNNKTAKIRTSVKKALEYFKNEGFINGYVENVKKSEKNAVVSVTIRY